MRAKSGNIWNQVWRTISVGLASALTCAVLAILTVLNTSTVNSVMEEVRQQIL